MIFEILEYDFISDIATGGAEISTRPEPSTPIPFAQFREFLLHFSRRSPFGALHELADGYMWWDFHKHVHMIARQNAADNPHPHLFANLADYIAHARTDFPGQNFVSVLWNPNDMITMMKNCVTSRRVAHNLSP